MELSPHHADLHCNAWATRVHDSADSVDYSVGGAGEMGPRWTRKEAVDNLYVDYPWFPFENIRISRPDRKIFNKWLDTKSSTKKLRSFYTVEPRWVDWFQALEPEYRPVWEHLGIYEALHLSIIPIQPNFDLIGAIHLFWSSSTNAYYFPWGIAGPHLLDVCHLTGLPCDGMDTGRFVKVSLESLNPLMPSSFPKSYDACLTPEFQDEHADRYHPHVYFLVYWLSRFFVGTASLKPNRSVLKLALAMHKGERIALAPYFLGLQYHSSYLLTVADQMPTSCCGSFWFIQLWAYAYFQNSCVVAPPPEVLTYGHYWYIASPAFTGLLEYLRFFFNSSVSEFTFMPFVEGLYGNVWIRSLFSTSAFLQSRQTSAEVMHIRYTCWWKSLVPRHIPISLGFETGLTSPGLHVERYCPAQFARQFGRTQAVPFIPPMAFHRMGVRGKFDRDTLNGVARKDILAKQQSDIGEIAFELGTTELFNCWYAVFSVQHFTFSDMSLFFPVASSASPKKSLSKRSGTHIPDASRKRSADAVAASSSGAGHARTKSTEPIVPSPEATEAGSLVSEDDLPIRELKKRKSSATLEGDRSKRESKKNKKETIFATEVALAPVEDEDDDEEEATTLITRTMKRRLRAVDPSSDARSSSSSIVAAQFQEIFPQPFLSEGDSPLALVTLSSSSSEPLFTTPVFPLASSIAYMPPFDLRRDPTDMSWLHEVLASSHRAHPSSSSVVIELLEEEGAQPPASVGVSDPPLSSVSPIASESLALAIVEKDTPTMAGAFSPSHVAGTSRECEVTAYIVLI